MPDIMCSCQYCLVIYRPTSVHASCVLTILSKIVVLYNKSEDGQRSEDEIHVQC